MSLSDDARRRLIVALADNDTGTEVSDLCDDVDGRVAAAVADVDTADGSDAATTQALANALKAKVNALLAALRTAGLLAE